MSDKPMLFSPDMVRAILAGRKTVTRREVKGAKPPCAVGDVLWVREAFMLETCKFTDYYEPPFSDGRPIKWVEDDPDWGRHWIQPHYRATDPEPELIHADDTPVKWNPSIHMPRWASRISLRVVDVRQERLQDIIAVEVYDEGVMTLGEDFIRKHFPIYTKKHDKWQREQRRPRGFRTPPPTGPHPIARFAALWDSLQGPGAWDANPMVWRIQFERIDA